MRNFERLQELPGTVAAGLQAGEVVLAIDRAMNGEPPGEIETGALLAGEALLRHLADPEVPVAGRSREAQHLMGADTALDAIEVVNAEATGEDFNHFATELADVLHRAAENSSTSDDTRLLKIALRVFFHLGDLKLARVNALLRTPEEPLTWQPLTTTSTS
jgi:hypothetical protein